jgi:CBS domain-containing protein
MLQADLTTIITYNPWAITADTRCGEVLELLGGSTFHHWPVVDEERCLAGMLSIHDLVRAIQARAASGSVPGGWDLWQDSSVADIMSRRVTSIPQEECLGNVVKLFLEYEIDSLPVLQERRLIGLITTSDLLREFWYSDAPASRASAMDTMRPAGEPIDCDGTLDEAAVMMRLASQDFLCVVRGDLPLGVVSLGDLLTAKLRETVTETFGNKYEIPGPRTVLELAAAAPTIRPGDRISKAAGQMVEHHRQAVAITNQAGRLLGVVTEDAILRAMLGSMD